MQKHIQTYLAEVLGTYVLVFVGAGAVVGFGDAGVAPFAFGLALLVGLYIFGDVSGGHFNPIVSLSMLLDRRMSAKEVGPYWIAQCAGAILAALSLLLMSSSDDVAKAATVPGSHGVRGAFFAELFFSAIFMLVILVVTKSEAAKSVTYIVIGLALMAIHFGAVPWSGSSVNPARSLGTALVGWEWTDFWIYLVAPPAGAILGWMVYAVAIKGDMNLKDDFSNLRKEVGGVRGRPPDGPGDGTRGTGGPPPEGPGDGTRDTA
jgi:aquaporin Z